MYQPLSKVSKDADASGKEIVMYEKLDKLRADVRRWRRKLEDDKVKLKLAEQKLQEASNSQILADVGALNLTPEQLAEFLKLVSNGQTVNTGAINTYMDSAKETSVSSYGKDSETNAETKDIEADGDGTEYETMNMEDLEDEENKTQY